jgi:hypothetical protein
MTHTDVERHLLNWAAYMQRGTGARGYPSRLPVYLTSGLSSWEDLSDQCDAYAARAVSAALDGLERVERDSVDHVYLLTVWRYPGPVEPVYERAVYALGNVLGSKGLV